MLGNHNNYYICLVISNISMKYNYYHPFRKLKHVGRKLTGEEMSKIPSYEYIMEFLSTPKILEIFDESVTKS